MSREQMVEKLADAIAVENWDEVCTCEECALNPARRLLDAILPIVTTAAESEALHPNATLITPRGFAIRAKNVAEIDFTSGCLTVAWQPDEVTA